MSDLESFIRASIRRYLDGEISAEQLNDLLPDGWDLDESDDDAAADLTLMAIGYLAGYQAGDREEQELQTALRQLVGPTIELEYRGEVEHDLFTVLFRRTAETILVSVEGDSSLGEEFERSWSQHPRTEHQTTTALLDPPGSRSGP